MLRIGSYVWYHDRTDALEISELFQHCDVILCQRFPLKYRDLFPINSATNSIVENWKAHGMLTTGDGNVMLHNLVNNTVEPNSSQGRCIPILKHPQVNIINCLTSYDIPSQMEQIEQVMTLKELLSGPVVICGDMHYEDHALNNLYAKHNLINHMTEYTFTNPRGERLSLDKILTTPDVEISDITVHSRLAKNRIEHYPFEFTINVK
jgi:hypothetical protein